MEMRHKYVLPDKNCKPFLIHQTVNRGINDRRKLS